MPLVNGKPFYFREWHQLLGQWLDRGLTVREAAARVGKTERACMKAIAKSEHTDRPIGRSVRSRSTRQDADSRPQEPA